MKYWYICFAEDAHMSINGEHIRRHNTVIQGESFDSVTQYLFEDSEPWNPDKEIPNRGCCYLLSANEISGAEYCRLLDIL